MRLLLTVTREDEVATALEGGADLVDAKDPARGSLGPPSPGTLAGIAGRLSGRAPLGVPLGDGPHAPGRLAARVERALAVGASYLKLGLLERSPGGGPSRDGSGPAADGRSGGGARPDAAGAVAAAGRWR
jgi:dihydroneopterin aldolase